MTDIALRWIDGVADIALDGADLLADEGLETAVIISLFCDARAEDSDVLPDGEIHRRGWWGDQFATDANDRIGSKLWLLSREKAVPETLQRARTYAEESLAWFKSDGVASAVSVEASFVSIAELTGNGTDVNEYALVLAVKLTKPTGTHEAYRFAYQWQQQELLSTTRIQ